MYNRHSRQIAAALRLHHLGYAWNEVYEMMISPPKTQWRLVDHPEELSQVEIRPEVRQSACVIPYTIPGNDRAGLLEACIDDIKSDSVLLEMLTAAYRRRVGWKCWLLRQSARSVRFVAVGICHLHCSSVLLTICSFTKEETQHSCDAQNAPRPSIELY